MSLVMRRTKLELKTGGFDDSSDTSSSIGRPDDDGSDDDADEVQSTLSLGSLEDSLPIKRGLSKHYVGKSKSFGNLAEVKSVKELNKSENPFNKRRRTLMALNLHNSSSKDSEMMMKRNKKSSAFYSHSSHISMPLLPLAEADDDDDNNDGGFVGNDDEDDEDDSSDDYVPTFLPCRRLQRIHEHPPLLSVNLPNTTTTTASNVCNDRQVKYFI